MSKCNICNHKLDSVSLAESTRTMFQKGGALEVFFTPQLRRMKGSGDVRNTQLKTLQTTLFTREAPTPYPDSGSACKFYLFLLCKAISPDDNIDSSIFTQTLTFLALSRSWATLQQANSWSVISLFGGLASCEKGHNVGDLPHKSYTATLPLPWLILICTRCSYCCWLTDLFFCMQSLVVHYHNYMFRSPEGI